MGVRNCKEIGENLQKIVLRLMANQTLVKLLYFTDKDPLGESHSGEFWKQIDKKDTGEKYSSYEEFCQYEIYEKLIKIVPRVGPKETSNSIIAIQVTDGMRNSQNGEFRNVNISIETFTPLTQWIIKSDNLRPFMILGEIQGSLVGKTVNGLGKIDGGNFSVNFLTEEISCYQQEFNIISYE